MSGVFTIPPDLCFVTTLAEGLWSRVKGDPLALAAYTIYLPTRRSCRHLRDAFLRASGGAAALLPRMMPLGDIDETEMDFSQAGILDGLPPAISPLRRQMLLVPLIMKKDPSLPMDQAFALAKTLGQLIDQVQIEERSFDDLETLVPQDYAAHWQETLLFLEIVTKAWPHLLEAEGAMDPSARRNAVLSTQIESWTRTPPDGPILSAGSTGSSPVVGRLMTAIARLPKGEVILPGLDLDLDEPAWQAIDDTHAQAVMRGWLEQSKISRLDVLPWEKTQSQNKARVRLLSETLRPASVTECWQKLTQADLPKAAIDGLCRMDLDHSREEADVIAVCLRQALECEGLTAALVTPDRALASRVSAALGRWGIAANDSAGAPLPHWPLGSYLCDVLAAADPCASPVSLLSFLKHALTAAGLTPEQCLRSARIAEILAWRGVRLVGGFSGAAKVLREKNVLAVADWLDGVAMHFHSFQENWHLEKSLSDHMTAHIALCEAMARTPDLPGADRLWRGEAGDAASKWLDEWRAASVGFPLLSGAVYARLFSALIQTVTVRPSYGQHPRLSLLGPLEARLLRHDVVVLGGLNEGTWPPAPPIDPWLSRPMKAAFGLPSPERRIGLSAHDFEQLACGSHVIMTRARRTGAAPQVPSRFLLQLETVLQAAGYEGPLQSELPYVRWASALDVPAHVAPALPPNPRPPLEARPITLSVTEITTWLCNPYAIYAKHVLRLRKLEDIDADVSAADHGTAIHQALEKFIAQTLEHWPSDPLALLLEEGQSSFAQLADRPQVRAFWWPRFEQIAQWFVSHEAQRRAAGINPLSVEDQGVMIMAGGRFTLKGRADRIDIRADGTVEIIDYKTGAVPQKSKVTSGIEPQLSLLALIAKEGGFRGGESLSTALLSYWRLNGSEKGMEITCFDKALDLQIQKAADGLSALISTFADPRTAYYAVPRPKYAPRYNDYEHLSRVAEWGRDRGVIG